MVNGAKRLPDGWEWTTVGECSTVVTGRTPSKKDDSNYGSFMPFVKPPELLNGSIFTAEDNISEKGTRDARVLPVNSVLVSCIGNLGKTGINRVPVAFNQQINAVIFPENIIPEFGFYYFQSSEFKQQLEDISSATTVAIVNKSKFESLPFPIAPHPEQERIVNRIEELFSDLEAGVAALERVRAGLRRYKASVLKAAVEGKLVNGKLGNGEGELPEGWRWATLEELSSDANYGTSQKCDYTENEFPVVRIPNIISGNIDLSDLKFAIDGSSLREKDSLAPGDLLIIRTNGSRDLIGKSALIRRPLDKQLYFASYLIRYRITDYENVGAWIATIWDSPFIRAWLETVVSTTAGQYNLNIAKLNKLPVPLPPLEEQRRIVAEVERRLSVVGEVESAVEVGLVRAGRLRQSVLRSAFEGRL